MKKEEIKNKVALALFLLTLVIGPILCYQKITGTGVFKKKIIIEITEDSIELTKVGISKEQWDLAKKYQFANTVLYK